MAAGICKMYYKKPSTAAKLVVELTTSSACASPCVTPWIYIDGALVAPKCEMNLTEALSCGYKLDFSAIAADIIEGVNSLHSRGIIHCDLSPAHVLLRHADNRVRASLCGLSNAQFNTPAKHNQAYTLPYRAPEVDNDGTLRACEFSPAADMYAVGILMYKMRYPQSRNFDRCIINQHDCSVEYFERSVTGRNVCGGKCDRPCRRRPIVGRAEIRLGLSLLHDTYDSLIVDLLSPNPVCRPTSEAALQRLAPAGTVIPRITCAATVDCGHVRQCLKKYNCDDDAINFIIECLHNRGRFITTTPEFAASVARNLAVCAPWFIGCWRVAS